MKDVIVKIYPNIINQFIPEHPASRFQKLIIAKGCHGTLHYKGDSEKCRHCNSDNDYLFLHFNITGSADICIGEIINRSDI